MGQRHFSGIGSFTAGTPNISASLLSYLILSRDARIKGASKHLMLEKL